MKSLFSIERVVAFVVAPLTSAAAGLVTQLASTGHLASTHTPSASYALSGLVSLGTVGSFVTWLHGRQKSLAPLETHFASLASELEAAEHSIPAAEKHALLADFEKLLGTHLSALAERDVKAAEHVVSVIRGEVEKLAPGVTVASAEAEASSLIADAPYTAPNDPAPASLAPVAPVAVAPVPVGAATS